MMPAERQERAGQRLPEISASSRIPFTLWLVLGLTAALSLAWSHYKLLSQDEFFVLQTDSVRSWAEMVHIQRHYPISLDPLVYHSLAHAATRLFGATAFALRLPSLLGFLLMQACLFGIARRLADARAGVVAAAFPALTQTLLYSAEGRPYGLLLGFYALALLNWQKAARAEPSRRSALVLLAGAVGLTLNTHYFGVLLLVPLCGAELYRTWVRRRIDFGVAGAIAVGMACIAAALPFQRAAGEFRRHYYNAGAIGFHAVTQAYRSLFVDYTMLSAGMQRVIAALFAVLALGLVWAVVQRLHSRAAAIPPAESVFLLLLAALPFFGFLLARFVTHSIEVRYVLGAIVGVAAFVALVAAPSLQRDGQWRVALTCVLLLMLGTNLLRVRYEMHVTAGTLAGLEVPATVKTDVLASPSGLLYFQNVGRFELAQYYMPDLALRARTALVYSSDEEIRFDGHDTEALTGAHMRYFTGLHVVPYEQLRSTPGEHVFVLYHSGWDWTDSAFAAGNAQVKSLGPAAGGDAAAVRF